MSKKFKEKLDELIEEFPEYYIEVWGPDDFKEFYHEITKEQCIEVATKLKLDYDPLSGTNMDFVQDTVEIVTSSDDLSDWDSTLEDGLEDD